MIPVTVRIRTRFSAEGEESEVVEAVRPGLLSEPEPGQVCVRYTHEGRAVCLTLENSSPCVVKIRQSGETETEMVFAEGERHTGVYRLHGGGEIPLTVRTHRLFSEQAPEGIFRVELAYETCLSGFCRHAELSLQIRPRSAGTSADPGKAGRSSR